MDRSAGPGEDLVAGEVSPQPLRQGGPDEQYPENEQLGEHFQVGGVERSLPDALQLDQLVSYIESTYDSSAPNYLALLPDRITHASMLMLGSAVDHTMPGVAYAGAVDVQTSEWGQVFVPSEPTGAWAVTLYAGPDTARDYAWRPDVAATAELSGVTIIDVDNPLDAAAVEAALAHAADESGSAAAVWAFGETAPLVPEGAGAYALTFPTGVPAHARQGAVLVQVATRDEVATPPEISGVAEYHSTHYIATPAESRRRVRDVAEFLRATSAPSSSANRRLP
ncbi:alpha/beta hydrolase [Corynebacterium sp. Q4381]|uniref:alpha/beta hydrolase n=1 Tax=Corynebacterium sp. Marseille-Q4381 TaxID=3121597 RepID=UPI002FE5D4FD